MAVFTKLEEAALHSIFSETPELVPLLERQFKNATVTERENTGGGFFTTIEVAGNSARVNSASVLGYETQARLDGLEHGLGFVLFLKEGKLNLLEGFAWGPENTATLDFGDLGFEVYRKPIERIS